MPDPIVELQSRICHTLANPSRLQIVYFLDEGERNVTEIAEAVGLSMANASQHLAQLRQVGIVESRREGLNVYYRLASPRIKEACRILREFLAEHLVRQGALADEVRQG